MTATEGTKTPRNIRVTVDMTDLDLGTLVWTPGPHTQEHLRDLKAAGKLDDFLAELREVITEDIAANSMAICSYERERQLRGEVQDLIDELSAGLDGAKVHVVELTQEIPGVVGSAFDMLAQIFGARPRQDDTSRDEAEDPAFATSSQSES